MSIRKILLTHWFRIERVVWKLVQLYVKPLLYMVVMSFLLTWNSRSPCHFLVLDEPGSVFQELEENLFDYYQHCNLGHCLRYGESLFSNFTCVLMTDFFQCGLGLYVSAVAIHDDSSSSSWSCANNVWLWVESCNSMVAYFLIKDLDTMKLVPTSSDFLWCFRLVYIA